jgi:hypothetical protein
MKSFSLYVSIIPFSMAVTYLFMKSHKGSEVTSYISDRVYEIAFFVCATYTVQSGIVFLTSWADELYRKLS